MINCAKNFLILAVSAILMVGTACACMPTSQIDDSHTSQHLTHSEHTSTQHQNECGGSCPDCTHSEIITGANDEHYTYSTPSNTDRKILASSHFASSRPPDTYTEYNRWFKSQNDIIDSPVTRKTRLLI